MQFIWKRRHKFLTLYTETANAKAGLVIVHGIGVHRNTADRVLRSRLPMRAIPLSIRCLFGGGGNRMRIALMPEAVERIKAAVKARATKKSLSSRTAWVRVSHAYFKANADTPAAHGGDRHGG